MRSQIANKFVNVKHKWIYVPIKSNEFSKMLDDITTGIKASALTAKEAIDLIECFKQHKKAWIKFKSVRGRSNLFCECEVITKSNKKVKTAASCEFVLTSEMMPGTPKSLKLYNKKKTKKYTSRSWQRMPDNFVDNISYPPVEEELTELGYALYKEWQQEITRSKMSAHEYKLATYYPYGYTTVKVRL